MHTLQHPQRAEPLPGSDAPACGAPVLHARLRVVQAQRVIVRGRNQQVSGAVEGDGVDACGGVLALRV